MEGWPDLIEALFDLFDGFPFNDNSVVVVLQVLGKVVQILEFLVVEDLLDLNKNGVVFLQEQFLELLQLLLTI